MTANLERNSDMGGTTTAMGAAIAGERIRAKQVMWEQVEALQKYVHDDKYDSGTELCELANTIVGICNNIVSI